MHSDFHYNIRAHNEATKHSSFHEALKENDYTTFFHVRRVLLSDSFMRVLKKLLFLSKELFGGDSSEKRLKMSEKKRLKKFMIHHARNYKKASFLLILFLLKKR